MRIRRSFVLSLVFIILTALFIASCAPARRPNNTPTNVPGRQTRFIPRPDLRRPYMSPMPSPGIRPWNRTPRRLPGTTPGATGSMQERAEALADVAAEQKEIESATCIITGNTALIGVQFDKQYKGELTDRIKKAVEEKVKAKDDRIQRVIVTADPDMVSRIEEIFEDIGKGKPLSGFVKEINEMINRIQPR